MSTTLLVDGTDLTRYDRTIMLADWGAMLGLPETRGGDVVIPYATGRTFGPRTADARSVAISLELVGTSAANTWPADPVAEFYTNLATLKSLVRPSLTATVTLTLQPAGTTCEAFCERVDVAMQTDFWATVVLEFDLVEGTL